MKRTPIFPTWCRLALLAVAMTIYSGQELWDLLDQAGFTDVKLFGSFDGAAYDQNAQCLIAVARRSV